MAFQYSTHDLPLEGSGGGGRLPAYVTPATAHHASNQPPRTALQRRFAAAGEAAVDLLSRLLAFDPARRCSPEEALAHEYFSDMSVSEGGE